MLSPWFPEAEPRAESSQLSLAIYPGRRGEMKKTGKPSPSVRTGRQTGSNALVENNVKRTRWMLRKHLETLRGEVIQTTYLCIRASRCEGIVPNREEAPKAKTRVGGLEDKGDQELIEHHLLFLGFGFYKINNPRRSCGGAHL